MNHFIWIIMIHSKSVHEDFYIHFEVHNDRKINIATVNLILNVILNVIARPNPVFILKYHIGAIYKFLNQNIKPIDRVKLSFVEKLKF